MDEGPKAERRFKGGWNDTTGAKVGEVHGPGDGLPAHNDVLPVEWGRALDFGAGDVVGFAEWSPPELLWIYAYNQSEVPVPVVEQFRQLFPQAEIASRE